MKLGIKFNLPFRFIDEGNYNMIYKKVFIKIDVKLIQNFEASEKIMGIKIETSGEGAKVDLNADSHGLVNFTQIKMEVEDKSDCTIECYFDQFGMSTDTIIKITSMQFINRLAEVVRSITNNYWIRFINLRDMMNFEIFDLSQKSPLLITSMNFSHGYTYPDFHITEQSKVKDQIDKILKDQIDISTWRNLVLDAINYFTMERNNEAVITINVALESFVAEHLYNKLNEKNNKKEDDRKQILCLPKSLHQIMKRHFPILDGRNFENQKELWEMFDEARNTRTYATHSFTKKISKDEAFKTIQNIRKIIEWIEPSVKIGSV